MIHGSHTQVKDYATAALPLETAIQRKWDKSVPYYKYLYNHFQAQTVSWESCSAFQNGKLGALAAQFTKLIFETPVSLMFTFWMKIFYP